MLETTIDSVFRSKLVDRLLVVSPERDLLPNTIEVLRDDGCGLNEALHRARNFAFQHGAREIVVLHADLPTVTAGEIDVMIAVGRSGQVAIAPDVAAIGTNAIYLRESEYQFQFDTGGSYRRHEAEAKRRGLMSTCVVQQGLANDIDTVGDIERCMPWRLHGSHDGHCGA